MKRSRLAVGLLCAASLAISGCAGPAVPGTDAPPRGSAAPTSATSPGAATSAAQTIQPSDTPGSSDSGSDGSATEELLLAQQVRLQQGGDGIGPTCDDDKELPEEFTSEPGVWLHNLFSQTEYPQLTVLCLHGFRIDDEITVDVSAGAFSSRTTVQPTDGAPEATSDLGYEEEPATTLFDDGSSLRVYTESYGPSQIGGPSGSFVSEMWQFVPPDDAREAMAKSGSVTIVATQGDLTARIVQPVPTPDTRAYYLLSNKGRGRSKLILIGYPAGAKVPVGLYRMKGASSEDASLVEQVGSVTVPPSRVADYTLPKRLLSSRSYGSYCVLPPVEGEVSCESLDQWPPFPGSVSPGDEGRRVAAWQDILIGAEVMSDIAANHDGVYGPATEAAVEAYLDADGFDNPDGRGTLGEGLYRLLTGRDP